MEKAENATPTDTSSKTPEETKKRTQTQNRQNIEKRSARSASPNEATNGATKKVAEFKRQTAQQSLHKKIRETLKHLKADAKTRRRTHGQDDTKQKTETPGQVDTTFPTILRALPVLQVKRKCEYSTKAGCT